MTPGLILIHLGGVLFLMIGFRALLFRLGDFKPTAQERRNWLIIVAGLVAWAVLLAFIGPLPPAVSVLLTGGGIVFLALEWRSRRSRLERVPVDAREEVARRQEWMRAHRRTVIGLSIALVVLIVFWSITVTLVTRPA
jgi:hypothetical protein